MIIALGNNKSSVGKTTTAINLAAALIEAGRNVRLWDMDGQRDLYALGRAAGLEVEKPLVMSLRASIAATPADFHIIECSPRKEFESETVQVLSIVDALIVPNECEYMMLRGLGNFANTIRAAQMRNPDLKWRALVTKFKPRQKKHLAAFLSSGQPQFQTIIRDSAWVADAPIYDKTVLEFAPRSGAARAFRAFAKEVEAWK